MLREEVSLLLANHKFLTTAEIAKALGKDKGRVYGYLEAMVDYGDLSMKKAGNSKVYYMEEANNETKDGGV